MPDPRLPDLGAFRHRVAIQSASPGGPSPAGVPPQDADETWTTFVTCWAAIEPQPIHQPTGVDTPRDAHWSLIWVRNPGVPVTTAHRLQFGDRTFVIDGVQRDGERNEFLRIETTENTA